MKIRLFAAGVLLTVAVVGAVLFVNLLRDNRFDRAADASVTSEGLAQAEAGSANDPNAGQVTGDYSGNVDLSVTVGGVYSDTLVIPRPPDAGAPSLPDLGTIDLSLQLRQAGTEVTGHVKLDKTLVFAVAHTLGSGNAATPIGPYLTGTFDGTNLDLVSEQVPMTVSGRNVLRKFRLTGTSANSDGSQISGEYRETIWGYTSVPVTVIGTFRLQRPVYGDNAPTTSNQAPLATADRATTGPGKAVTIQVLANDSDLNGNTLTLVSLSRPQYGMATIVDQSVVYTPNSNFSGIDTFSYVVSDGNGGTTVGSVTVLVDGTNRAPTAANDTTSTTKGVAVMIDVLANDTDPDGDALFIAVDGVPAHGTATVTNGQIAYMPQADFVGIDSFTYTVGDGRGGTTTATVTITVTANTTGDQVYLPLVNR